MILRILLGIVFSSGFAISEPAWFQVCDRHQKHQLNSEDCSLGLWIKRPILVECVCVNGVWVISNGLCDKNYRILVGSGDCFDVNYEIQSVKLIGHVDNPFAPATYVVTPGFDTLVTVLSNVYSPSLDSPASIVISINLTSSIVQRSDNLVCLEVDDSTVDKPVHIWKNFRRESNRFKTIGDLQCEEPMNFNYHVNFGEIFQGDSILTTEQVSKNCANQCLSPPGKFKSSRPQMQPSTSNKRNPAMPFGRGISANIPSKNMPSKQPETRILWDDLYSINRKLSFINGANLTPKEKEAKKNIFLHRHNMSESNIAFAREAREQTVRMMQAHTNYLLLNQPTPKINTYEYDYFQFARRIFSSVAPSDLIPIKFVNGITRMFRQLAWESHDKFTYTEHPNKEQHYRIVTALQNCLLNVSRYPMVFIDRLNFSSHGCLNKSATTFWNGTESPTKPGEVNNVWLSNTSIPQQVKFVVNKLDFVVEMAWKIAMFTHYHCSVWFQERAYDHSQMSAKLMSLFNHKVSKRWMNPQDSMKAYQVVFQNANFDDIAFSTDRVVEAARDGSEYTKWLVRPPIPISPEDLPGPGLSKLIRPKREAKSKAEKQYIWWGNRAACMTSYTDPTDKFHYSTRSDCFVSRMPNEP